MYKFTIIALAALFACASGAPGLLPSAPLAYANAPLYAAGGSNQIDVRNNYDGTLSSYTTAPFSYTAPYSSRYVSGLPAVAPAAYTAPLAAAPAAYTAPFAAAPAAYAAPAFAKYAAPAALSAPLAALPAPLLPAPAPLLPAPAPLLPAPAPLLPAPAPLLPAPTPLLPAPLFLPAATPVLPAPLPIAKVLPPVYEAIPFAVPSYRATFGPKKTTHHVSVGYAFPQPAIAKIVAPHAHLIAKHHHHSLF
ncbi:translation initiation factor IF-2-like [Teleopsis dalmanni]|uniref:translation initiation factor IF-2-like n=1 Tax=Teleopsis dalmanni TaxID=139649 RepID=UPI0018CCEEA9|nr:translation initiation factor IF-2-like [Teleopsis dalmanni]